MILQCFEKKGISDSFLLGTHQIKCYIDTGKKNLNILLTVTMFLFLRHLFIVH